MHVRSLSKEVKTLTKTELRKAILLKEILGKPKALEKKVIKNK